MSCSSCYSPEIEKAKGDVRSLTDLAWEIEYAVQAGLITDEEATELSCDLQREKLQALSKYHNLGACEDCGEYPHLSA